MKLTPHKWADQQIAAPGKLQALLHALASFANPQGRAYPSQETIGRRLGWSKGTIKKWSDVGRALGLFSTKKRFNAAKGHVDAMIYTLHLDRVITAEEVAMQIANLRFPPSEANRKNGGFPSGRGKSQKRGGEIATDGKQLQNSMKELELTKKAGDAKPSEGGPAHRCPPSQAKLSPGRDWLLVSDLAERPT